MTEGTLEVIGSSGALVRLAEAYLQERKGGRKVVAEVDPETVPGPGVRIMDRSSGCWAFIAAPASDAWVEPALRAVASGASGVISLASRASDLEHLLDSLATGELYVAPEVAARITQAPAEAPPLPATGDSLTLRERDVIQLVAEGLTNAEIAGRLEVSVSTVRTHLRSLGLKIEASGRPDIQARARALGLAQPGANQGTTDKLNKSHGRRG